jgi:hypothetical protein
VQFDISGCRSLLRLDKEIRRPGQLPTWETRYFISSLNTDEVSAATFQDLIQRHWEVENCLHLQKDRYYEEDKHVLRRPGLGVIWTVLTNMAVSLTNLLRNGERTLKEVREKCRANPKKTAKKFGWA